MVYYRFLRKTCHKNWGYQFFTNSFRMVDWLGAKPMASVEYHDAPLVKVRRYVGPMRLIVTLITSLATIPSTPAGSSLAQITAIWIEKSRIARHAWSHCRSKNTGRALSPFFARTVRHHYNYFTLSVLCSMRFYCLNSLAF